MPLVILELSAHVTDEDGHPYTARVLGEQRPDGMWIGTIEFRPRGGSGQPRRTAAETTQPNRAALAYWATGLEPIYLEGALERAISGVRSRGRR